MTKSMTLDEIPGVVHSSKPLPSEQGTVIYHQVTLKSPTAFDKCFSNAKNIRIVTYCNSPEQILTAMDELNCRINIVVGGKITKEEYRQELAGKVEKAERLLTHRENGDLRIYLYGTKDLHSKLYLIENHDGTYTHVSTSANFSYHGWGRQTNQADIWETTGDTWKDDAFEDQWELHRDHGSEFLADLEETVATSDDDRETEVQAWVDGRGSNIDELAELNKKLTEELDDADVETVKIVGEWEDADTKLAFSSDPEEADELVERSFSLRGYSNSAKNHISEIERFDATVSTNNVRATPAAIAKFSEELGNVPRMWFADDGELRLQRKTDQLSLMRDPHTVDPEVVAKALENLHTYFQTVDDHGDSLHEEVAKAHMYEALLTIFWMPFSNSYASVYRKKNLKLDKNLPFLYIHGESNSGKGTFIEFALSLLSDGYLSSGVDADDVTPTQFGNLRKEDSCFPVVIDEVSNSDLSDWPLLNYWSKWDGSIQFPNLVFISNQSRPKPRFRNRAKLLHFDVFFDDKNAVAESKVHEIINTHNPIYSFFTYTLNNKPIELRTDGDILAESRDVMLSLYEYADVDDPDYFPKIPAEREHSPGRRKWQSALNTDRVTLNERNDNILVATFEDDMNRFDVREYANTLPTTVRPSREGAQIEIQDPNTFQNWLDDEFSPLPKRSLLARLFDR